MFKWRKKKNLIYLGVFALSLLFLSSFIPALRRPVLDILKFPFNLLILARREIGGIIFYHRNFSENERLKKEIGQLRNRLSQFDETYSENKRLKSLLSFKEKSAYKTVAAQVIGRSPDNWSSVIIVDKGRYQGIKTGAAVITSLGLAGRVVETSILTSKVMLVNDPNLAVSGIVKRSRQEGLVCGTLGKFLLMKYLTKDADVRISDVVITSGLTQNYPKGLLIGIVVEVGEEFSGLSRYCLIKPIVKLSDLEEVLIVIP